MRFDMLGVFLQLSFDENVEKKSLFYTLGLGVALTGFLLPIFFIAA